MSEPQQSDQRAQQQPTEPLRCFTCFARVRFLDEAIIGPDGYARRIQALPLDAATLAVADASLAVLDAQEKQTGVWEQSPAAMVHHGDRWISESKAARWALEEAAAQLQVATLALRAARAAAAVPPG